jgi:hypothetical protein
MNALLVFLMVFASAQTFSAEMPDVNSSWEEISNDRRVIYKLPQLRLGHGSYTRAQGACVDGENLRTIKKVTRCTEYHGRNDRCVSWEIVYPSRAINGTQRRCIRRRMGDNDDYDRSTLYKPLFAKHFAIGQCK